MKLSVWENEKGLQIDDYNGNSMEEFRAFWRDLKDKYTGYTVDFCYHNCFVPVDFMLDIDAKVLESCIETRLSQEHFILVNNYELTLVTNENFAEFATLHDNAHPESSGMFWTSERVYEDFNNWLMYMHGSNYILMRLGRSNVAEVYALEAMDKNIGENLLSKASEYAFKSGKTGILQMVEDNALAELEIVKSVGFVPCGKYIAYQAIIK